MGFTPTDFVIVRTETRRVRIGADGKPVNDAAGNPIIDDVVGGPTNVDDPPGGSLPRIPLLIGEGPTRISTYVRIGPAPFGPVTATVPIAFNGIEPNGVPRLFAAQVDSATGDPVLNTGPGHCFIPTTTRINDSQTGAILPAFAVDGPTTEIGFLSSSEAIPTTTFWGLIILLLLLFTVATIGIRRWQPALAMAGPGAVGVADGSKLPLLHPALLGKVLAGTFGLAVVGFGITIWVYGPVATRDVVGTLISAVILAYLLHLWIPPRRGECGDQE